MSKESMHEDERNKISIVLPSMHIYRTINFSRKKVANVKPKLAYPSDLTLNKRNGIKRRAL